MIFESFDYLTLIYVLFGLVLSGSVKGIFGIGFPVVAMAILPLFVTPITAITVIALPIVVTNIQQLFSEKEWKNLYKLSEETFVEETDSLKKSAAGAGLTDND